MNHFCISLEKEKRTKPYFVSKIPCTFSDAANEMQQHFK